MNKTSELTILDTADTTPTESRADALITKYTRSDSMNKYEQLKRKHETEIAEYPQFFGRTMGDFQQELESRKFPCDSTKCLSIWNTGGIILSAHYHKYTQMLTRHACELCELKKEMETPQAENDTAPTEENTLPAESETAAEPTPEESAPDTASDTHATHAESETTKPKTPRKKKST
jgi:hypothetical protein